MPRTFHIVVVGDGSLGTVIEKKTVELETLIEFVNKLRSNGISVEMFNNKGPMHFTTLDRSRDFQIENPFMPPTGYTFFETESGSYEICAPRQYEPHNKNRRQKKQVPHRAQKSKHAYRRHNYNTR